MPFVTVRVAGVSPCARATAVNENVPAIRVAVAVASNHVEIAISGLTHHEAAIPSIREKLANPDDVPATS